MVKIKIYYHHTYETVSFIFVSYLVKMMLCISVPITHSEGCILLEDRSDCYNSLFMLLCTVVDGFSNFPTNKQHVLISKVSTIKCTSSTRTYTHVMHTRTFYWILLRKSFFFSISSYLSNYLILALQHQHCDIATALSQLF